MPEAVSGQRCRSFFGYALRISEYLTGDALFRQTAIRGNTHDNDQALPGRRRRGS
jgi:hypothetical protein